MRLLVELLIIAALIYFGWNTPFKDPVDQADAKVTSALDSMESTLQKQQDQSVRRY
jgi:Tfp pilus assembly protein PilO